MIHRFLGRHHDSSTVLEGTATVMVGMATCTPFYPKLYLPNSMIKKTTELSEKQIADKKKQKFYHHFYKIG